MHPAVDNLPVGFNPMSDTDAGMADMSAADADV
jgi:hypothetical protein